MKENDLSRAKIGDTLYHLLLGYVVVDRIHSGLFPIEVEGSRYSVSGLAEINHQFPLLFWDQPEWSKDPEFPVSKVKYIFWNKDPSLAIIGHHCGKGLHPYNYTCSGASSYQNMVRFEGMEHYDKILNTKV